MSRKRYPLRITRTAHGIRAQDLRTLVRTTWWARRWIGALEAMRLGPRLGRARQYAIAGQVTSLEMEGSHVEACVTGSRPDPYTVKLDFSAAPPDGKTARTIQGEPMLLARLLTDDLPTDVEDLLRQDGVALFPKGEPIGMTPEGRPVYDVKMNCNCPDWARPCKHIIAVLLLLGEEIAHHPATLLSLRGVDVEDLVAAATGTDPEKTGNVPIDLPGTVPIDLPGTVPIDLPGTVPISTLDDGILTVASDPAPLLKRLGPVPYWRGGVRCQDALAKIYGRVRPLALEAAEAKSIDLRTASR